MDHYFYLKEGRMSHINTSFSPLITESINKKQIINIFKSKRERNLNTPIYSQVPAIARVGLGSHMGSRDAIGGIITIAS